MSAEEKIINALQLASDILDTHTENTETDKAYRNAARLFIEVLDDEEVQLE